MALLCIDPGRRGDSVPEIAFAFKSKLLYWNASPQKTLQPTAHTPYPRVWVAWGDRFRELLEINYPSS
ncbi:MAG: hypothetical protein F6J93_29630 [Oscillatoria sp. SIO1A7]|nr:hypothetical protein [Oscillatoria sp. SIO1A7]